MPNNDIKELPQLMLITSQYQHHESNIKRNRKRNHKVEPFQYPLNTFPSFFLLSFLMCGKAMKVVISQEHVPFISSLTWPLSNVFS